MLAGHSLKGAAPVRPFWLGKKEFTYKRKRRFPIPVGESFRFPRLGAEGNLFEGNDRCLAG